MEEGLALRSPLALRESVDSCHRRVCGHVRRLRWTPSQYNRVACHRRVIAALLRPEVERQRGGGAPTYGNEAEVNGQTVVASDRTYQLERRSQVDLQGGREESQQQSEPGRAGPSPRP